MSFLPQFLGMRERHDEHRAQMGRGIHMGSSWSDCDACLAIAAWDELQRMLEDLTPGGSEFYREPERCIAYLRGRLERTPPRRILELEEQLRNCRQGKTLVKRERDALRGTP